MVRSIAIRICAAAAVGVLALNGCAADQQIGAPSQFPNRAGRGQCAVTKESDVPATMRDGTVLRADVYRPRTSGPAPVILMRTQYGKSGAQAGSRYQPPDWFASQCYLVVIQDAGGLAGAAVQDKG